MLRKSWGLRFFLAAEAVLYIAFLYCDLAALPQMGNTLKYGSILVCLLFSVVNCTDRDGQTVTAALAFTALADLFLLVLDRFYAAGVACFCVVQLLYALRLRRAAGGKTPLLWLRILLSAGTIALLWILYQLTPLTALVCLYFPQLVCNAAESMLLHAERPWRLFSLGLVLFLCCDVCVGLHNVPLPSAALAAFAQFAMWLFYLPSQVLITLSAQKGAACCE